MKLVSILNNKGGVGKTTTAVNLSAACAEAGLRVLLVDLDPAASASVHLNFEKEGHNHKTLCDFIINSGTSLTPYIYPTESDGLFLVPSEPALHEFYEEMQQEDAADFFLQRGHFDQPFDLVFFDSPPNMGNLALNALAISDAVLVPVQTQFIALTGLELTNRVVDQARRHLNSELQVLGYLATMYDQRTRAAKDVHKILSDRFGQQLFETVIRINSKLVEAYSARKPVLKSASSARGAKEYRSLAREVLKRLDLKPKKRKKT